MTHLSYYSLSLAIHSTVQIQVHLGEQQSLNQSQHDIIRGEHNNRTMLLTTYPASGASNLNSIRSLMFLALKSRLSLHVIHCQHIKEACIKERHMKHNVSCSLTE